MARAIVHRLSNFEIRTEGTMKDLFSGHASDYASYRPHYPRELFELLFSIAPAYDRAWDVATGNGQVARYLASNFKRVDATDISSEQLDEVPDRSKLVCQKIPAENSPFPDDSFDLITVAQALHWFDVEAFHREVHRVARAGAAIAEWGYGRIECKEEGIDRVLDRFYRETVGPYWDAERVHVDREYQDLDFPFEGMQEARFWIEMDRDVEGIARYLRTWSSVQHYIRKNGKDPVSGMEEELKRGLGDRIHRFYFPVFLRWGRVN